MPVSPRWLPGLIAGALLALAVFILLAAIVLWAADAAREAGGEINAERIRSFGLGAAALAAICTGIMITTLGAMHDRRIASIHKNLDAIVEERSRALVMSRSAVILGLAKLAESRDDQTGRHLERIRHYVRILGEEMMQSHPEIDQEFVDTIVETSALHDIGKVGTPDQVLLKPGPLTDAQRETIQKHPLIGGDTLLAVKRRWGDDQFLVTACEIIFAHHERWDGEGYPFGLKGEIIPLSARIVALADVYDALTTERVYKPKMTHDAARELINEGSGSHFDPKVVAAFLRVDHEFARVREEIDSAPEPPPLM